MTYTTSYKARILTLFVLGLGGFFMTVGLVDGRAVSSNKRGSAGASDDDKTGDGGECTCRGASSPASATSLYSKALYYRQLYCLTGYHLQILDDGKVSGTKEDHDIHAIMLIDSAGMGVITIKGVKSDYFLAMNEKGELYGRKDVTDECKFREKLIEDWYLTYSSNHHPNRGNRRRQRSNKWFVGLDSNGSPKKSRKSRDKAKGKNMMSRFRTKPVDPMKVPELYEAGVLQPDSTNAGKNFRCILRI